MIVIDVDNWSAQCRDALARYSEPLLRSVTAKLIRPRVNQPVEELLEKSIATLTNPPVIDRRIRELPEPSRKLLGVIGLSQQPRWRVGHLMSLAHAFGEEDRLPAIQAALAAGLLYPVIPADIQSIEDFTSWFGAQGILVAEVFAHPAVALRARGESLGLPVLSDPESPATGAAVVRIADGLDWPLRLGVVWQQVLATPVRFTQSRTLFKKVLTRLQTDEVLTAPPTDLPVSLPDVGILALLWAAAAELLVDQDGELTAAAFPAVWETGLMPVLEDLFAQLTRIEGWDPLLGYEPSDTLLSSTPTAGFLLLLLLASVARSAEAAAWVPLTALADWLWTHHPDWAGVIPPSEASNKGLAWVQTFLHGIAYPLQLVEVQTESVRLSALGRHLLAGGSEPPAPAVFPQTLLVQPNAEILAYRQGLHPGLIATLSRFARWKGLGPACTLELTAEQTYRGLESGLTLPMIVQALTRHASRPIPAAVSDLLQRWASKRERITIYTSAVLVEFGTPAELDVAIARGIVTIRLTDRIGITAEGTEPALSQLRLIANRDYETRPQRCVTIGSDGVTLTIDSAAADLLLDTELARLAIPLQSESSSPRRFRLDPELLRRASQTATMAEIDTWFVERSGQPLSPAGRLIVLGPQSLSPQVARLLVVRFPMPEIAEGAMQWPETRALIAEQIGPTTVVVEEENLNALQQVLADIGITVFVPGS